METLLLDTHHPPTPRPVDAQNTEALSRPRNLKNKVPDLKIFGPEKTKK
jgi:hypothetical protein